MRILMLATEYPPAHGFGLGRYASELAAALVQLGHEVHVVTANFLGEKHHESRRGVHVHTLREAHSLRHYSWVGDAVLGNVFLLERALDVTEEYGQFDVVLSHDWLGAHVAKALKNIHRIPWLLVMHDTEVGKRENRLTRQQAYIAEMENWSINHADHLLTTNEYMRGELSRIHHVPLEKISTAPCGVRLEHFLGHVCLSDFRSLLAAEGEPLVAYVGRLSPMKGVEDLIEAFILLSKSVRGCRLILAGEGVLRNVLEQRLREEKLAERVLFTGWLSDNVLGALYRVADVVVVPSRYEPFGMVALEAAACGAPVIAAETGGLAEIIGLGEGGILGVPPREAPVLASAMVSLVKDPKRARQLAESSRDRLRQTYSWKKTARAVSSAIKRTVTPAVP